jgi:hypothetical protein
MKIARTIFTLALVAMAAVATTSIQAGGILEGVGEAVRGVGEGVGAVVEGTGRAVGDVIEGTGNVITGNPSYRQGYYIESTATPQPASEPIEDETYEYED